MSGAGPLLKKNASPSDPLLLSPPAIGVTQGLASIRATLRGSSDIELMLPMAKRLEGVEGSVPASVWLLLPAGASQTWFNQSMSLADLRERVLWPPFEAALMGVISDEKGDWPPAKI